MQAASGQRVGACSRRSTIEGAAIASVLLVSAALAGASMTVQSAHAVDRVWVGDPNDNFNAGGNWSPAGVPGTLDTAIIAVGTVTPPYNVLFFTGLFQPIDAVVDRLRIDSAPITFTIPGSTLTIDSTNVTETGRGLVIGRLGSGTPTAQLDTLLAELSTVYATLGADAGSSGTLNVNGGLFSVTGTSAQFALIVGLDGGAVLNVIEGDAIDVAGNTVLGRNAGSSGFANVGGGATWTNDGSLIVGYAGQGVSNIASPGALQIDAPATLGDQAGSNGDINVSGIAAAFNITAPNGTGYELTVGRSGVGTIDVGGGGDVSVPGDTVLASEFGSTGSATISGPSTQWIQQGEMHVGYGGSGTINISGGALLQTSFGYVGGYPGSAAGQGSVDITGANSHWDTTSGWISLGSGAPGSGSFGSLTVTSAGRVTTTDLGVGYSFDSEGSASVSGIGSRIDVISGDMYVGLQGDGTLNISGGGEVEVASGSSSIAWDPVSTGEAIVTGAASRWDAIGPMTVGESGIASLAISDGGRVTSHGIARVGMNQGSSGEVTIDGTGSWWLINNCSAHLRVGDEGAGTITITNDGHLGSGVSFIGHETIGVGHVTVDGLDTSWIACGPLRVGFHGQGTLDITNGSHVESDVGELGWYDGSSGLVNVSHAQSIWTVVAMNVGVYGDATFNVTDGGEVWNLSTFIGHLEGSDGALTVSGANSLWTSTSSFFVGRYGHGVLNIEDGGEVASAATTIAEQLESSGEAFVTGAGSSWITAGDLNVGNLGNGKLTVSNSAVVQATNVVIGIYGEVHGNGQIIGDVQSSGIVFPGASADAITIDGDYLQTAIGDIIIELASPSSFDQVLVTGDATLDGILTVEPIDGFEPPAGHSFTILTASAVTGRFAQINSPIAVNVIYTPTSVIVEVPGVSCPADIFPDMVGDGVVGAGDLGLLLAGWGRCPRCDADLTSDGVIDAADLAELLAGWGTCP